MNHFFVHFVSFIILGMLCFYEAWRYKKHKGIMLDSFFIHWAQFVVASIVFIFEGWRAFPEGVHHLFLFVCMLAAFFLFLFFIHGKRIHANKITEEMVIAAVEKVLQDRHVAYQKITGPAESGYSVQEYKRIKLQEYDLEMRITWGDQDRKGLSNYTVTFKKWWRFPYAQELLTEMVVYLREQRKDQAYHRYIYLNAIFGILSVSIGLYLLYMG
ncbi:Ca2+/Na+ antiporter [Caldalkalibacillus uzonensis]|uniref:Ca2+/Na+ antiporter n=1 Tax=Caldalkalibacillus uzonensis TaxID=353224 RepID=A0ABU0CPU8_9BACI|nr:hypothetical protein [Caldalkalibacillus uzonensis]MDQ0338443.1 Ca2+/Na+ antiporter [Caldalkalibacillus uzonensis]